MKAARRSHLERDLLFLSISSLLTVTLIYYGLFEWFFFTVSGYSVLATFVAGFFFTSLFTIAPATTALVELTAYTPLIPFVVSGVFGSVIGDCLLFFFVRDIVTEDIVQVMNRKGKRWFSSIFKHPLLQWIFPVVGALIIASPLPDEFGLALMGLSKTRLAVILPLSIIMNGFGLTLLWLAARVL